MLLLLLQLNVAIDLGVPGRRTMMRVQSDGGRVLVRHLWMAHTGGLAWEEPQRRARREAVVVVREKVGVVEGRRLRYATATVMARECRL